VRSRQPLAVPLADFEIGNTLKRFHIHLHVDALAKSIGFYSKLFATESARIEGDYAKYLGIQTDDPAELAAMKTRAEAADMALLDEGETTCCYARSEKHWVTDPQGIAWEHFHTLADIPVFNEATAQASTGSACCAPTPRGKPIGIPVKSSTSCC
jgi:hypothetical protein